MIRTKFDIVDNLRSQFNTYDMMKKFNMNSRIQKSLKEGTPPGMVLLRRLCEYYNCQPGDIIEWVPTPGKDLIPERRPWGDVSEELKSSAYINMVPGSICMKVDIELALKYAGYGAYESCSSGVLPSPLRSKIRKGGLPGHVQLDTLCEALRCQPGDLIEYVPEEV